MDSKSDKVVKLDSALNIHELSQFRGISKNKESIEVKVYLTAMGRKYIFEAALVDRKPFYTGAFNAEVWPAFAVFLLWGLYVAIDLFLLTVLLKKITYIREIFNEPC